MNSDNIEYNINGIGTINIEIFGFSGGLLKDSKLNLVYKLKGINQLGAIRYVHNGAHYTRYEYVLLQIMLINFVKDNGQMGLNSKRQFNKFFNANPPVSNEIKISGADLLILAVIYGNMGYFKDTFSSNKVWYYFVKNDIANIQKLFKKGLKGNSKKLFNIILDTNEFQRIQWLNSLFILSRKSEYSAYREICELILEELLSNQKNKYIDLYRKLRKVSYIVMDSHFSHIPISIDLKSILFDRKFFVDQVDKKISGFMDVFSRMNDLLEDTLYLENNAILIGAKKVWIYMVKLMNILKSMKTLCQLI